VLPVVWRFTAALLIHVVCLFRNWKNLKFFYNSKKNPAFFSVPKKYGLSVFPTNGPWAPGRRCLPRVVTILGPGMYWSGRHDIFFSAAAEQTLLPSPRVWLYHQRALAATLLYIKQGSDGVRNESFGIILRTNSFQIYRDASTLLIHTQLCRYRHVFMSKCRICTSRLKCSGNKG